MSRPECLTDEIFEIDEPHTLGGYGTYKPNKLARAIYHRDSYRQYHNLPLCILWSTVERKYKVRSPPFEWKTEQARSVRKFETRLLYAGSWMPEFQSSCGDIPASTPEAAAMFTLYVCRRGLLGKTFTVRVSDGETSKDVQIRYDRKAAKEFNMYIGYSTNPMSVFS